MSGMSDKHPVEGLMASALSGLREMIDVNAIVGSPINCPDGSVIMPVSRVALGFGVGGSEFPKNRRLVTSEETQNLFGGGTGGGLSLTPVGFLVVGNGAIRMVPVSEESSIYERIIEAVPSAIDKISEIISSVKAKPSKKTETEYKAEDDYIAPDPADDED